MADRPRTRGSASRRALGPAFGFGPTPASGALRGSVPHLERQRRDRALLFVLAEVVGGRGDIDTYNLLIAPDNGIPCELD